jgi:hypothetical protein
MIKYLCAALCLTVADANVGPKTSVTLIARNQKENNVKGSSLVNDFWVFTYDDPDEEDKGVAVINMDNTLTMNGIEDDSTVYWGTLVLKVAGTKTSYDCALCQHHFVRSLDSVTSPTAEELAEMESRWGLSDSYFQDAEPVRKEVAVLEQF